jgi:catechol 2,3-dioxygenase-like lactoylglutathione lyase family enzyme
MESRISLITLGVSDLPRARAFYEAMGWKASSASQAEVAFFQGNGLALALFSRQALAEDATVENTPTGFAGITLAYNGRSKAEVDAVFAQAVDAGAKPVKRPHDVFWGGYSGYFADPDGHLWEVAWNPLFPLDERGNLFLPDSAP